MNQRERNKILKENFEVIYDEYSKSLYNLLSIKPFLKDLIDISKGKTPLFDLSEIIDTRIQK